MRRSTWIWQWLMIIGLFSLPAAEFLEKNVEKYFDRSIPEYEVALTASDFEQDVDAQWEHYPEYCTDDSDILYKSDLFEGDIANKNLNASTMEMFLNGGAGSTNGSWYNAIKNRHQLWPKGRIPYAISSQYSSYSRSQIAASMKEYSIHTCIHWVPKTDADVNYIYIFPDRGCYSMVGKIGGKQTLSLGAGCIQKGIIIHEMMHAVGFFHEQSRTDRDEFITILWNNIIPGMQGQFEKYGQGTIQSLGANYDYSSIMHYGSKAFSRNGQPTMIPKKKGAQIGQRGGFSSTDIYKLNKLYGCPNDGNSLGILKSTTAATTVTPTPITTISSATLTLPPITLPSIGQCKNLRGDCDELRNQGWCERNPFWMKSYCPVSCGFCEKRPEPGVTLLPITTPVTPPSDCEDLRVDCLVLVSQRYCKISQAFMKVFCAKSCGFCFRPPPTDPTTVGRPLPYVATTALPYTQWRTSSTPTGITISASPPTPPFSCKDKKRFCAQWKMAGFCEGIFNAYMKKNCAASCDFC